MIKKYSKKQIIDIVAQGEALSNHPIAKSILDYYGKEIKNNKVTDYKEIAGKGISYTYEKKHVEVNNQNLTDEKELEVGTVLYVNIDNKMIGKIIIGDKIKKDAKGVIASLKKQGIRTMMLTGDNKKVALSVANELGIDDVKYELLPSDKYNEVEKILNDKVNANEKVAFVGDGINDAPVLTLSNIGISMGTIGSSSAIEASDIVLMTDDVYKIITSINVSKRTTNIVKQNLIFSIGVKLLFIILNLFGLSTMAWAVFADVGVTIIAILNSIRILK